MNNSHINRSGINSGASLASWVISAAVIATSAASVVSCEPLRTTYGSASANAAAVTSSVTATVTSGLSATGIATAQSEAIPHVIYAGGCLGNATATGTAVVLRNVYGAATGEATSTGFATLAQAIGEASGSSAATVIQADAHRIRPGAANTTATATGGATGDVIRYAVVNAQLSGVTYTRAEASLKLNGESFYTHDGYVPENQAVGSGTGSIQQDATKVTVTNPVIGNGTCASNATAFIIQRGSASGVATSLDMAEIELMLHTIHGEATGIATSTASANGTRVRMASANAQALMTIISIIKPSIRHAAGATGALASLSLVGQIVGVRTTFGAVSGIIGSSELVSSYYGVQFSGDAMATATCEAIQAIANYTMLAEASGIAGCVAANPIPGKQHFGSASGNAASSAPDCLARQKFAGAAQGNAGANVISITANTGYAGSINTTMASSLSIQANGMTNSDVKAPDERYMMVQQEDRAMFIPPEERILLVAA